MDKNAVKETLLNFIVPLISILATVVIFLLVIRPSIAELPDLEQEVESKTALKNQLQTKLATLNKLIDFRSVVQENADLAENVLAPEPMVPELLTQIDTIAQESGLEVTRLNYSIGSSTSTPAPGEEEPTYSVVNVNLGADGSYEQLVSFMNNLEQSARVVNVDTFRYTGGASDTNTLGITFSISSPYLAVESEAVTDTPIDIDVTGTEFVEFMNKMKALRLYEPVVNEDLVFTEATEEETDGESVDEATELDESEPTKEDTATGADDSTEDSPFSQ